MDNFNANTSVQNFPNENALNQLSEAMKAHGLPCSDLSDKPGYHRFSCRGTKDRDEWYEIFYVDGDLCAEFGTWRISAGISKGEFFSNPNAKTDSAYREKVRVRVLQIDEERAERAIVEAATWADRIATLPEADPKHPYLVRKRVKPHGIKQYGDMLEIPIYDEKGKLISIQKIWPDGQKGFAADCIRIKGRHYLGNPEKSDRIYVAEGFATGASIYEALDEKTCVAITFGCSNCNPVAFTLQEQFPNKKLILAQDLGLAGEKTAIDWREFVEEDVKTPDFKGKARPDDNDWNDLACHPELGPEEVKKQLQFIEVFEIETISHFLLIEREKPFAIVEELFSQGSVNLLYGPGGASKSMISMDTAVCISNELPIFGLKTVKQRTLYVDGEMTDKILDWRLRHTKTRFDGKIDLNNLCILTREKMFKTYGFTINLFLEQHRKAIERTIKQNGITFVIFDAISYLMQAEVLGRYEHVEQELFWIQLRDWSLNLASEGITQLFLTHSLKGSPDLMKGSSTINIFMETIIKLQKQQKGAALQIDPKFGWPIQIEYEKNRHFTNWEVLPKQVRLVRDPDPQYMPPDVYRNHGWRIDL